MSLVNVLTVVWMHFVADFILQSDKMAINKSKSNGWLLLHVGVYSLPFFWFGVKFVLVQAAAHFTTDWVTSRATSWLWKREERHWFFVVIGLDQAIHLTCLMLGLRWL